MASHTLHPDTHEHGLADNCPRCAELAADPFTYMDDRGLRLLYARTCDWMLDDVFPRSDNELDAMRAMERAISQSGRLRQLNGEAVAS